ncbi:hypothetical protein MNEG_13882 [Monoraphidium neglectum]|uniref:Uncharacterized protein n=1 Tax=Monoraphidium neglectum TaxID=145388 RepID=A0A0D2KE20_9CHLO|nr:hypothetical protein MNEG_13882 [Monoraphidium neglectum]KIY94078.1 hypothetical protein MNEG_13882 [Monoraphidium neglectum]|eukprot:XP_013893098.1 hypothetical protein MNEG_13882 [Monoraphidium neglectum]
MPPRPAAGASGRSLAAVPAQVVDAPALDRGAAWGRRVLAGSDEEDSEETEKHDTEEQEQREADDDHHDDGDDDDDDHDQEKGKEHKEEKEAEEGGGAGRGGEGGGPRLHGGKEPEEVQLIAMAPKANVTFGGDIDPDGACSAEIKLHCLGVDPGEGALADCIGDTMQGMDEEDAGAKAAAEGGGQGEDAQADTGEARSKISAACREEVLGFRIERNSNINKNVPLARACAADAVKHCNVTWFFGYRNGSVISCLKTAKAKLTPDCRKHVSCLAAGAAGACSGP